MIIQLRQVLYSFLTEFKLSQILLHNEDSLLFVKGMLMTSLVTADVSDDVAQELLFDAQTLEDVESFAVRSRHS